MLHVGHVLFVLDASRNVLFLRRSDDVVTCPGTWSVLGEHATQVDETPRDAVVRGIEEELGFEAERFHGDERDDPPGSYAVRLRAASGRGDDESAGGESGSGGTKTTAAAGTSSTPSLLPVSIYNATELPLYYVRHYGPRNGNRVDRQVTYLWYAIFPKNHDEIIWRLDDEVSDHRWVSLEGARAWLSNDDAKAGEDAGGGGEEEEARRRPDDVGGDAIRAKNNGDDDDGGVGAGKEGGGGDDDGPDAGDFCHGTIRSLYEVGLEDILSRQQQQQQQQRQIIST